MKIMYNKVSSSYQKKRFYDFEDEPPEKKLVSDADVFIKELGEKQRNTKTNLEELLTLKKEFYKANEFISLTSYTSGSSSLEEFNAIVKTSEDVEKLKSYGLRDDEIELLFDYQKGHTYFNAVHKNMNENVLKERLQHIIEQINNNVKNNESKKHIESNRHKTELILSEKPRSVETRLLKFALENQHKHKEKVPHPMDNLKDIEEQFNKTTSVNIKKIRRKARSLQKQIDEINTAEVKEPKIEKNVSSLSKKSKWDIKDPIVLQNDYPDERKDLKKLYTCSPQNYYTIKDNQIIRINPPEKEQTSEEYNNKTKLSLDEIKKIPKFENYTCGKPSKVLYLKNLMNNVTEEDLINIISKFTEEEIASVKTMKGKMRGQAFVEMQTEAAAHNVLNQCNGIILKNKPIIIQFGKGKNR